MKVMVEATMLAWVHVDTDTGEVERVLVNVLPENLEIQPGLSDAGSRSGVCVLTVDPDEETQLTKEVEQLAEVAARGEGMDDWNMRYHTGAAAFEQGEDPLTPRTDRS